MHRYSDSADDSYDDHGASGCLSGLAIPPLVVLAIGGLFVSLAFAAPAEQAAPSATAQGAALSAVFTPEVQFWSSAIVRWAADAGVDPNLVAAIMQIESCGDPFAQSRAGAMGLFQVMPYHFRASEDPFSPDINARRGLDYLKRSLAAAGDDVRLAFAGYNGGISVISIAEWAWPDETGRYAYWGSGIYSDALSGTSASSRLAEWMSAGGKSLCRTAAWRLGIAN